MQRRAAAARQRAVGGGERGILAIAKRKAAAIPTGLQVSWQMDGQKRYLYKRLYVQHAHAPTHVRVKWIFMLQPCTWNMYVINAHVRTETRMYVYTRARDPYGGAGW